MSRSAKYRPGRYASIDIGTVTCRLLVADVDADGHLTQIARDREITNLGEGVDATGRLSEAAMDRVARTMDRFVGVIRANAASDADAPATAPGTIAAAASTGCVHDARNPQDAGLEESPDANATAATPLPLRPVVIATSASRDAENADEFAALLAKRGLELAVISGEKEAALSFLGATQDFPGEHVLVVDSGGGSTEVVAGVAGEDPTLAHSFNIGCRRATERFLAASADPQGPIEEAAMDLARAWVRDEMAGFFGRLRAEDLLPARMIAVAGTATTAVSVREAMQVYDALRVHGATVTRAELDDAYQLLARLPLAERAQVPGLEPRRAPVICAGFAILSEVMGLAGVDRYTVSETDILQGIVLDAARA